MSSASVLIGALIITQIAFLCHMLYMGLRLIKVTERIQ